MYTYSFWILLLPCLAMYIVYTCIYINEKHTRLYKPLKIHYTIRSSFSFCLSALALIRGHFSQWVWGWVSRKLCVFFGCFLLFFCIFGLGFSCVVMFFAFFFYTARAVRALPFRLYVYYTGFVHLRIICIWM